MTSHLIVELSAAIADAEVPMTDRLGRALDAIDAAFTGATLRPYENEDGQHIGWYVDTPEVYCDIERDDKGEWSIFFRERNTRKEAYAVAPTDAAQPEDVL